jgi:hypothetical protein
MLGLYSHFAAERSHRANRALLLAERMNAEVL